MDSRSCALLYCWLWLWIGGISGADPGLDIIDSPSDACVCEGQLVQLDCTVMITSVIGTIVATGIADQIWKINLTSSMVIEVSSIDPEDISYSIIRSSDKRPIGLNFSATNIHDLANFTCIGFDANQPGLPPVSTNAALLDVADLDDIPCNVSCPSLYSYDNSSCTVSWTKPLNASCDVLSGYTVIISGNGMSTGSPMLDIDTITYITGRLEAFQSYTASVIATSTCGSTQPINVAFMTSREQRPHQFDLSLLFNSFDVINISLSTTLMQIAPRVAEYTVVVKDVSSLEVLTWSPYPGDATVLSLDIRSLPPCENYTVFVTARNTALENTSASVLLSLDPLTSLEVSCVAEDEDCYLEANCVPSQPGLVSGCTLDYTRSASGNVTKLNDKNRITAMSCENQNISYNGTAYNSMLRSLGCPRSGVTKCHLMRGCTALDMIIDGTVQYSTEVPVSDNYIVGTVAAYSCADGYELVGEENRTCLVDRTWTGVEPLCKNLCLCQDACQDTVSHVWIPISITLLIYSVLCTAATVGLTLFSCRKRYLKASASMTADTAGRYEMRTEVPLYEDMSEVTTPTEIKTTHNEAYGPVK